MKKSRILNSAARQHLAMLDELERVTAAMSQQPPRLGMLNDLPILWRHNPFYTTLQDPARFATIQQFANAELGKPWSEPPRSSVMQPRHIDFLG